MNKTKENRRRRFRIYASVMLLFLTLITTVTATFAWWNIREANKEQDFTVGEGVVIEVVDADMSQLENLVPAGQSIAGQVEFVELNYKAKTVETGNNETSQELVIEIEKEFANEDLKQYIKVVVEYKDENGDYQLFPAALEIAKDQEVEVKITITLDMDQDTPSIDVAAIKNTNWKIKINFKLQDRN